MIRNAAYYFGFAYFTYRFFDGHDAGCAETS